MSEIRIIIIVSHLSNSNYKKHCNLTKQVLKFYIYEKYNTNKGHIKINFKTLLFGEKTTWHNVSIYCVNHLLYCFYVRILKIMFPLRASTIIYKGFWSSSFIWNNGIWTIIKSLHFGKTITVVSGIYGFIPISVSLILYKVIIQRFPSYSEEYR